MFNAQTLNTFTTFVIKMGYIYFFIFINEYILSVLPAIDFVII